MKNIILVYLFIILTCCSTHLDINYISSKAWRFESGYKAGGLDYLIFRDINYAIKHDTVLYQLEPIAIIYSLDKGDNTLVIKSMDGIATGYYVDVKVDSGQ